MRGWGVGGEGGGRDGGADMCTVYYMSTEVMYHVLLCFVLMYYRCIVYYIKD